MATVAGSGGVGSYTYLWDGIASNQLTATATSLPDGLYCVTVTDANACFAVACVSISEPSAVTASIVSSVDVSCFGQSTGNATVTAFGGVSLYTFLWDNAQTTSTATGLSAGVYCATVTDDNLCSAVACVTITQPSVALSLTATVSSNYNGQDISCNNVCDGEITAAASGGTSNYTYIWSHGGTGSVEGALCQGVYTIVATDAAGCTATSVVTVTEPTAVTVTVSSVINASCNGFSDGTATSVASGGTAPYNYLWSNGITFPTTGGLFAGNYCVTATDVNGCQAPHYCINITEPAPIIANAGPDLTESCVGACDVSIGVSATGGVLPLQYSIDGGVVFQTIDSFHNLCAGQYDVIVQDFNGCFNNDTMVVNSPYGSVWLGDANDDNIANNLDLLPIGLHHSATGTTRANASINWNCQPSQDWGTGINGNPNVDIKHVDCDGNGTINDADTNAIILNWSQTHLKSGGQTSSNGVVIYVDTATTNPGDTVSLPIILGSSLQPGTGYGIAFTVTYDTMGIDSGSV